MYPFDGTGWVHNVLMQVIIMKDISVVHESLAKSKTQCTIQKVGKYCGRDGKYIFLHDFWWDVTVWWAV